MKKLIGSILCLIGFTVNAQNITGAGATFPYPVYSKWAELYAKETGKQINYNSIGSSGGLKQIDSKTVDFGATDAPRDTKELDANNQLQFPVVIGGVVPVVNIPNIKEGELYLSGKVLADIFEGKITKWNDAAIKELNPSLNLPNLAIVVAVRADGSGTTEVFTDYLSQVSESFQKNIGKGKTVNWVNSVAGKGNAGVSATVKKVSGSIGYVEYAYAKQGKLIYAGLIDKTGKKRLPDDLTFKQAADSADWSVPGMAVNLNNKEGWPITAATFVIVYKQGNPNTKEVLKFFDWAFSKGAASALELDYVPLPKIVQESVRDRWKQVK